MGSKDFMTLQKDQIWNDEISSAIFLLSIFIGYLSIIEGYWNPCLWDFIQKADGHSKF